MAHHGGRLVDQQVPFHQGTKEHLQVAAAVGNGPHVQRGIEGAYPLEKTTAEGHVGPGTVLSCAEIPVRSLATLAIHPPVSASEAFTEAAVPFEVDLSLCFELVRRDQSGYRHNLRICERRGKGGSPSRIDDH